MRRSGKTKRKGAEHEKTTLFQKLCAFGARISFWQKIYLYTLALFLLCFNIGIFAVESVGRQRSFEAERDRLLTRQHFIAQTLAQDMAAVEARKPGAMSALTEDYVKNYADEETGLRITRAETVLADRRPQTDTEALPQAESEGIRSWSVLTSEGRRWLYASLLVASSHTSPMRSRSSPCLFTAARIFSMKGSGSSSATSSRKPQAPRFIQVSMTPPFPQMNSW